MTYASRTFWSAGKTLIVASLLILFSGYPSRGDWDYAYPPCQQDSYSGGFATCGGYAYDPMAVVNAEAWSSGGSVGADYIPTSNTISSWASAEFGWPADYWCDYYEIWAQGEEDFYWQNTGTCGYPDFFYAMG